MTDPPYRSRQAATETDLFAAVYARPGAFPKPGHWSVLTVTQSGGGSLAAPDAGRGRHARQGPDPRGRRGRPEGRRPTRSPRPRATRSRSTPAIPTAARRCTGVLRRRRRQEAGRAAVRDAAAVPVARLRPRDRHRAADEGEVRRPGWTFIHQEVYADNDPQQGAAQAAAGSSTCARSRGCSSSAPTARSPPGWRAPSA